MADRIPSRRENQDDGIRDLVMPPLQSVLTILVLYPETQSLVGRGMRIATQVYQDRLSHYMLSRANVSGCACDVPAHICTFSFEQNTEWSCYYVKSAEIYDCFLRFAKKHDLDKYVQLRTTVISGTWDDNEGKCESWN
jgi:hypothetical protein